MAIRPAESTCNSGSPSATSEYAVAQRRLWMVEPIVTTTTSPSLKPMAVNSSGEMLV